jgi:hypothetical protein
MPITFSESSSDEAAPAAQAQAVLKAGSAARSAAPKKKKASAPAAGKSASKSVPSFKTVGAKRMGRERSRLNLPSDASSDDADDLDLSDDDDSEKIAAALKQMAEQMVCARHARVFGAQAGGLIAPCPCGCAACVG